MLDARLDTLEPLLEPGLVVSIDGSADGHGLRSDFVHVPRELDGLVEVLLEQAKHLDGITDGL